MPLPQKRQKERGLLMMTVTARAFLCVPRFTGRENGVALLQVLLLSALLSLIAIRFSETARDQLGMASDLESRVKAQMAAHSTFNQVIFSQLSESIDLISPDLEKPALAFLSTGLLNRPPRPHTRRCGRTRRRRWRRRRRRKEATRRRWRKGRRWRRW